MKQVERVLAGEVDEGSGPGPSSGRAGRWLEGTDYAGLVIGHTHRRYEQVGDAWLLNPGESMQACGSAIGHGGRRVSWETPQGA